MYGGGTCVTPQVSTGNILYLYEILSISASSRIIYGSLPPNSKTVFFRYSPATLATDRPAGVLPVIVTAAIRGSFIIFSVFLPETDMFRKISLGKPAFLKHDSIAKAQP